jgi:hypothetical protein
MSQVPQMKDNRIILFEKRKETVLVAERLKYLNRVERHAVLATDAGGQPYTSLVAYSVTPDVKGILFATPKKTTKYKNILKNRTVGLLIDSRSSAGNDYVRTEAVTILGKALPLRRGKKKDELSGVLTKKHPELAGFIRYSNTSLILVEITHCYHVDKFQKVSEWHPKEDGSAVPRKARTEDKKG